MNEKESSIQSLSGDGGALVSYVLFTYNQEAHIRDTLEAAFAQTYSPLEIVISDDCSSDRTVDVIREVIAAYSGKHDVVFNINEQNMGIGGHVSKMLLELSSGSYIITVGGDDVSDPDHAKLAVDAIRAQENVYVVDFSASIIDGEGDCLAESNACAETLSHGLENYIQLLPLYTFAPGRILKREVFDIFGRISPDCPTEDSVIVLRALILGKLQRLPTNVIQYRRTESSISVPKNLKQLNIQGIVGQYRADVETAYEKGLIDANKRAQLLRRIAVDSMRRTLMNWSHANGVMNYLCRIAIKLLVEGYRLSLKLKNA